MKRTLEPLFAALKGLLMLPEMVTSVGTMKPFWTHARYGAFTRVLVAIILSLASGGMAQADGPEGTWRLAMRKLPDGTVLKPPAVFGLSAVKNGIAQTTVFWSTPEGKPASFSAVDKLDWSETELAATQVLSIFDDGSGKPPVYVVGGETKRQPVTRQGGRVSYQHPTHAPFVVWEGNKLTATLEGVFVDYWEPCTNLNNSRNF